MIYHKSVRKKFKPDFKISYSFSNNEEMTTVTDEEAIAADAIHGWRDIPSGRKIPAATGIPTRL